MIVQSVNANKDERHAVRVYLIFALQSSLPLYSLAICHR